MSAGFVRRYSLVAVLTGGGATLPERWSEHNSDACATNQRGQAVQVPANNMSAYPQATLVFFCDLAVHVKWCIMSIAHGTGLF